MIRYLEGDATAPAGAGTRIIAHVCNDIGGWGRGFVLALNARWSKPKASYKIDWQNHLIKLGFVRFVWVEADLVVANIVGQHGILWQGHVPPVRYEAIADGLAQVAERARLWGASVHMPRIGCALAGGTWRMMGPIVERELEGIDTTVYDFADTTSASYVPSQ